jgi:dipeptide/tripeptide permease
MTARYFVGDIIGRRREIILGGLLYVVGAVVEAVAP